MLTMYFYKIITHLNYTTINSSPGGVDSHIIVLWLQLQFIPIYPPTTLSSKGVEHHRHKMSACSGQNK